MVAVLQVCAEDRLKPDRWSRTDCTPAKSIVRMCCKGYKGPVECTGLVAADSEVLRTRQGVGLDMVPVRRRLEAGEDSRTVERAGNWLGCMPEQAVHMEPHY